MTYQGIGKSKRVVIIGSTGFIGSRLVEALNLNQIPVLGLSTKDIDLACENKHEDLVRLLHPEDAVVVLAVQEPNRRMSLDVFFRNIKIAENLCLALQKVGCAQIVYFSSEAVYSFNNEVISESSLIDPYNLYGKTHVNREKMFLEFSNKIPVLIVRPTQIYGPMANHNAYGPGKMCRSAVEQGKIEVIGQGEEQRDFISINDVIHLTMICLRHCISGIFNFATGRSISYAYLATSICSILGKSVKIESVPRKEPIMHRMFDITNLTKVLPGYQFLNLEGELRIFLKTLALNNHV